MQIGHKAYKDSCWIDILLFTMPQFVSTLSKRTPLWGYHSLKMYQKNCFPFACFKSIYFLTHCFIHFQKFWGGSRLMKEKNRFFLRCCLLSKINLPRKCFRMTFQVYFQLILATLTVATTLICYNGWEPCLYCLLQKFVLSLGIRDAFRDGRYTRMDHRNLFLVVHRP